MAIFASNLAPASTDRALGSAVIERSLRFENAYLNRTPSSAGNRKTFTISAWVKRCSTGGVDPIFSRYTANSDAGFLGLYVNSDDYIYFTGWSTVYFKSNRLYRDLHSWSHIVCAVDTTQSTSTDRIKLYFNGELQSTATYNAPSQNADLNINEASAEHMIGRYSSNYFVGYMAEINFVDGYQYDASYFGFTDGQTGMWMPKRYEGTYGTNGFRLDFSDNSSAASLGIDKSPNGNDYAAQSLDVGAGVGNDSVIDTPTNNFPILSKLYGPVNTTFNEGNLLMRGGDNFAASTFLLPKSGKWYAEFSKYNNGAPQSISVTRANTAQTNYAGYLGLADNVEYVSNGEIGNRSRGSTSDAPTWENDAGVTMAVAVDMDNGAVYFARDNTYINSGVPTSGSAKTNAVATDLLTDNGGDHVIAVHGYNGNNSYGMYANFGQQPFTYTPPAGYKSLCTKNIPPNVPSLVRPQRHFDVLTWTGNGSTGQNITGLEFKPDLLWIKKRNESESWGGYDSVRGVNKRLYINDSNVEQTITTLSAFSHGGFRVEGSGGGATNDDGDTYVGFCWKAGGATTVANTDGDQTTQVSVNEEAGLSIVTYTGTGSNTNIGHGLGGTPDIVMTKSRSATGSWAVLDRIGNSTAEYGFFLNDNGGYSSYQGGTYWNDTLPTSTVFRVSSNAATNASGVTYVAYCWRSIPGYSKIGKYTGNGNADGRFVYVGFRPAWVMFKRTDSGGNWFIVDSKRDPFNECTRDLYPNNSNAETNNPNFVDFLSNGFKLRTTGTAVNASGGTYIYMAFAEQPTETPFNTFPNAR